MMPWSGRMPAPAEHANEIGTSELHRTSIMSAARAPTTDRSMHPGRSQTKERTLQYGPESPDQMARLSAAETACPKPLDWDRPATEVWSLGT